MDGAERIVEAVNTARAEHRRLRIVGGGSKRDWLSAEDGELLETTECQGIVAYDPAELVVTARAGTPIRDILQELAQQGQTLAFEPPQFYGSGTIGGMVAAGISGPARPWSGSVRDAVLGVELVNGLGERLRFGGQVMKNVAGYDVSRLTAGACGALGVLLEVSLRVLPRSETVATLKFELDAQAANDFCRQLAAQYLPVNGTWWHDDCLLVRLAGSSAGVAAAGKSLGGQLVAGDGPWADVTHHSHSFFKQQARAAAAEQQLWRVVVPPASTVGDLAPGQAAIDWAGGQRWLWLEHGADASAYAQERRGWAWALGQPLNLDPLARGYMQQIKTAFDPDGLFVSPLPLGQEHAH